MSLGNWAVGQYIAADDLNALLAMTPQGNLGTWVSTANGAASSSAEVPIASLAQTFTITSPRLLSVTFIYAVTSSAASNAYMARVFINGVQSLICQDTFAAAGTPGLKRVTAVGTTLPVSAGTVSVTATIAMPAGSGSVTLSSGATLQLNDMGGA